MLDGSDEGFYLLAPHSLIEAYAISEYPKLDSEFAPVRHKIKVEQNHAILAGHTYQHETRIARINDKVGSLDANEGAFLSGSHIDQYPTSVYNSAAVLYEVVAAGVLRDQGVCAPAVFELGL